MLRHFNRIKSVLEAVVRHVGHQRPQGQSRRRFRPLLFGLTLGVIVIVPLYGPHVMQRLNAWWEEKPPIVQRDERTARNAILRQATYAGQRVELTDTAFKKHAFAFVGLLQKQPVAVDLERELKTKDELLQGIKALRREANWLLENYPKAQRALKKYRAAVEDAADKYHQASIVYAKFAEDAEAVDKRSDYEMMSTEALEAEAFMKDRAVWLGQLAEEIAEDLKTVEESLLYFNRVEHFVKLFPASADSEFLAEYRERIKAYIRRYRESLQLFRSFTEGLKDHDERVVEPAQPDLASGENRSLEGSPHESNTRSCA